MGKPQSRRSYGLRLGKFGPKPSRIGPRYQHYEGDIVPPRPRHRSEYEELWHAMAHTALLDAALGYTDAAEIDQWDPWAVQAMAAGMRMQPEEFDTTIRSITAEHARHLADVRIEHPWMVEPARRYLALRRTRWGPGAWAPTHWLDHAVRYVRPRWLLAAANRLARCQWRWLVWRERIRGLGGQRNVVADEVIGSVGLLAALALRDIERALGGGS
jgi:hypothetical protein